MTEYTLEQQTGGVSLEEANSVIAKGHPPEAEGVWLLDFDNTIKPFGLMFDDTPPYPGAAGFTQLLKRKGYTIGIFTSRLSDLWLTSMQHSPEIHINYITAYGKKYGIKFDFITAEKRPALGYIDDKAIAFDGDWTKIHELFIEKGWV